MLHRILYRGTYCVLALACFAGGTRAAWAQEERPQITPGERKVPRKKDAGPRAVGLLQLSANGKSSLVPITILVNGKFYDAAAYKANPIPMALETGTVYEAERTGNSLGLFTVSGALHSNAVNAQSPWIGTGAWLAAGTDAANKPLKAESVPVGIDNGDGPPRLTRNPGAVQTPAAPASNAPASTAPASEPQPVPSGSGDEPPRLSRPAPSAPPSEAKPADSKPSDSKSAEAKTADRPKGPESDSGASAENRPTLRRGSPTEALPEDQVPGYSKPGTAANPAPAASASAAANAAKIVEADAAKGPVKLVPAISDASGSEPRSFRFEWLKDEEGDRRKQLMDLAKLELKTYLAAKAKGTISAKPAAPGARRAAAKKMPEPVFESAQMMAYDLWANNQPVMLFAVDAHMPDSDLQYSILLVARTDIYNNLHKLYVGVTDKYHLDITPRLELIDAVDADGDGRGELLFREVSDAGTGWVIYRASADKLWKMFDSLNPE